MVDQFYSEKFDTLVKDFISLQAKFMLKMGVQEQNREIENEKKEERK